MTNKVYDIVTKQVIAQIEAIDVVAWDKPWFNIHSPVNAVTGAEYRGINTLLLGTHKHWASFKQWKAKGCAVKKGEKGSICVFWKFSNIVDENGNDVLDDAGNAKQSVLCRYYNVFHAGQVEGEFAKSLESAMAGQLNAHEKHAPSESLIAAYLNGESIETVTGDQACFYPQLDQIQMPSLGQFKSANHYYSTYYHEIGHSTGSKHRLGRDKNAANREKYAFEELVAELTSCFVMARMGLAQTPRPDHAHYLKSWLKALKGDNKFIIQAASQAQKACDFIMAYEQSEKPGQDIIDKANAFAQNFRAMIERRENHAELKRRGMKKIGGVYRWPAPNTSFAIPKARKCPKAMKSQYEQWLAQRENAQ